MARATTSLPVPLSPEISTVASVLATRSMSWRSFTIVGCCPIRTASNLYAKSAWMPLASDAKRGNLVAAASHEVEQPFFVGDVHRMLHKYRQVDTDESTMDEWTA